MKTIILSMKFLLYPLILFITTNLNTDGNTPDWVLETWATRTSGSGIWIADNSKFKSEPSSYDAYGLEWKYGLNKKHLKGRLYGIKSDTEQRTIWEFLEFWDTNTGILRIVQIGADGTVGQGTIWKDDDNLFKAKQLFTSPNGNFNESGHHTWMKDGNNYTQSYRIENGKWEKLRLYIWKPQKKRNINKR